MARLQFASAQTEKPVKYLDIDVEADQVVWNRKKDKAKLIGNVVLTQGDTVLKANMVDYDEASQSAVAQGSPHVINPQNDLTGDTIQVDFGKKAAVVKGNVKVISRPKETTQATQTDKKSLKDQWKDPMTLLCDQVEYFYKAKRMVASGNLKIIQKDRNAVAEQAVYTQKDEKVVLTGHVKCDDSKGQTFSSPKVTISLKQGDDWLEAEKVKATFKIKDDTDEEQSEAAETENKPSNTNEPAKTP
jgi:lipopolysaccharide assembly outer membrane protein LptD (OstA)